MAKNDNWNLQGSTILIKPEKQEMHSKIIHASHKRQITPVGMVLDTGPGCELVKAGDRVLYTPKKATRIDIEGVEHHFIPESDVAYIH